MPKLVARIRQILTENKSEVHRFLKFAVVGSIGFIVVYSMSAFRFLAWKSGKPIRFLLRLPSSVTFSGTATGLIPNPEQIALGHSSFSFSWSTWVAAINQAVFLSLSNYVFTDWGSWGYNIAKIIATAIVMLWNFFVNRKWTYGKIK